MKEYLHSVWEQTDKIEVRLFLYDWVYRAESSGIKMLLKRAKTIVLYLEGILNDYDSRISNGSLEGTSTKVRCITVFYMRIMAVDLIRLYNAYSPISKLCFSCYCYPMC